MSKAVRVRNLNIYLKTNFVTVINDDKIKMKFSPPMSFKNFKNIQLVTI